MLVKSIVYLHLLKELKSVALFGTSSLSTPFIELWKLAKAVTQMTGICSLNVEH